MLITLTIAIVIAFLFGKITIKEIKNYVRKHTEKSISEEGGKEGKDGEDGGDGKEDNSIGGDSCQG